MSQKYAYNDFGYLSSIVSVIAAASGALTTALYSGGVAVGGNMASQHYNYDAQVQNYNEARKKVQCIYRVLSERSVNESLLIKDDVTDEFIRIIRPTINSALDDIYFDLESKQSSVELKSADLKSLSDAFAKQKEAESKMTYYNAGLYSTGTTDAEKAENSKKRMILAQSIQASVSICKVLGDLPQRD
ncbi:hypothetical protein [Enterobacter soli]|uniref:hypothetical protein n=1 Tax=Enterobacter soli TaxID=885040 RepID=UPI00372DA1AD